MVWLRYLLALSLLVPGSPRSSHGVKEGRSWSLQGTQADCLESCKCERKREGDAVYLYVNCRGRNITDVPANIPPSTTHLVFVNTAIVNLTKKSTGYFSNYSNLKQLSFKNNPQLRRIGSDAFFGLDNLKFLYLSGNEWLGEIDAFAFEGLKKLRVLSITKSYNLKQIKKGVLAAFPALDTLKISKCALEDVPNLFIFRPNLSTGITDMDFSFNNIKTINAGAFSFVMDPTTPVYTLHLNDNPIHLVKNGAFNDSKIVKIKLNNTPLKKIEQWAFVNARSLEILHLDNTLITELPTDGLYSVKELYLQNVPSLEIFPSVLKLSSIQTAKLTYPSHCCAFNNPEKQSPAEYRRFQEKDKQECPDHSTTMPNIPATEYDENGFVWHHQKRRRRRRGYPPSYPMNRLHHNTNQQLGMFGNGTSKMLDSQTNMQRFGPEGFIRVMRTGKDKRQADSNGGFHDDMLPDDEVWYHTDIPIDENVVKVFRCGNILDKFKTLNCTPQPNALNPCEGVMGYNWLRVVVWFVVTMAVLGNMIVIVVSLCSRHKMTVSKFLMCNLAFSDLTLGLYLLILASIDIHTLGEYFNHAIGWQYRGGCQTGGFMAVFSQTLSVFTLTVITLERWYAISHAIHLTKRLRLRQAYFILTCGWGFALLTAMLPILSISSYSEVSICLPMKAQNFIDKAYLFFLLTFNTSAFVVILVSYIDMFRKVRVNATTARSNDATIAKRMSILVFTDFACLFPVCFFGITAAAGVPLISITESKILLVLFYPLNSCANPFLYAIFTKQFKKDLFGLLSKHGFCQKQAMKYRGATYSSNPQSGSQSRNNSLAMSAAHNIVLRSSDGSVLTQCTLDQNGRRMSHQSTARLAHVEVSTSDKRQKEMPLTLNCANYRNSARSSIPPTNFTCEMDYQKYKMFHEKEKSSRTKHSDGKDLDRKNIAKNQRFKHQSIPNTTRLSTNSPPPDYHQIESENVHDCNNDAKSSFVTTRTSELAKNQSTNHHPMPNTSRSPPIDPPPAYDHVKSEHVHNSQNDANSSLISTRTFDLDIHVQNTSDESASDTDENRHVDVPKYRKSLKQTLSDGSQTDNTGSLSEPEQLHDCEVYGSHDNQLIDINFKTGCKMIPNSPCKCADKVCNELDLANENHTLLVEQQTVAK